MFKKILLLAVFAILMTSAMKSQVIQVTAAEAEKLLSDKKLIVLDVRTAEEFIDGHIKGAINIDIKQPDGFQKIEELDHNAGYVVYCRTNGRSTKTVTLMQEKGFKNLYLMSDGFEGWKKSGLLITKKISE